MTREDEEAFADWLSVGIENGWVSKIVCATHDGLPGTEEEDAQWEEGYDPCVPAVRLWGPEGQPLAPGAFPLPAGGPP